MNVFLYIINCGIRHYNDQWAVHLTGGEIAAKNIAEKHGFVYVAQVS
jgi:hypothetical protein